MSNSIQNPIWIEFFTPSQIQSFELPPNLILVGDYHIQRGTFTVIGGPPGVGKSRAAMALAIAGATGQNWFDMEVKQKFRTMIIQNENGKGRLKKDFETINCSEFEHWIRICTPPPFGMAFNKIEFVHKLREKIDEFNPDIVIFDPWNSIAGDDKQSDYLEAFKLIRSVIPNSDTNAAIVIVAHTRKPKDDEKATGRELIHLLSGSHVLVSVPRSVFVMVPETSDVESGKIIWTCCKNNDGEMNASSVWLRKDLSFEYVGELDGNFKPEAKRITVTLDNIRDLMKPYPDGLTKKAFVAMLKKKTNASQSACYAALDENGKFKDHIEVAEFDMFKWRD